MSITSLRFSARCLCPAIAGGILASCASMPVPNERIAVAQSSVQRAEQSGAPELAPVEMSAARDELARAQQAAAEHNAPGASQLAERADVDAQLAEASAQAKRSHKAAAEFEASLQALRQETLRNGAPSNP